MNFCCFACVLLFSYCFSIARALTHQQHRDARIAIVKISDTTIILINAGASMILAHATRAHAKQKDTWDMSSRELCATVVAGTKYQITIAIAI